MSAETLRRAASLMRARAGVATDGRWEVAYDGRPFVWAVQDESVPGAAVVYDPELSCVDAEHIASWHPTVALAVADWLDASAYNFDITPDLPSRGAALAVARAYLGEPA